MHLAEDLNQNNPNLADNPIQLNLDFSYVTEAKKKSRVVKVQLDDDPSAEGQKRAPKPR